jgi:hypothetical protein
MGPNRFSSLFTLHLAYKELLGSFASAVFWVNDTYDS